MSDFIFIFATNVLDFAILSQYLSSFTKKRCVIGSYRIIVLIFCAFLLSIVNWIRIPTLKLFIHAATICLYSVLFVYPIMCYVLLSVLYIGCVLGAQPVELLAIWMIERYFPHITEQARYVISVLFIED